jgi:tetratricopeptide (TPR) repeat protein
MQRTLILPLAALLILPALGCAKVKARADLKKGNSYYTQEQYSKAMDYYQKGLELDPDATFAWRSLGLAAIALYRPGDESPRNLEYANTAIDAFEKYLAEYPDDDKIPEYLMSTYVNAKKYDEALAFIDRRIQEKPEQAANLQRAKVTILTQAGRLDKAFQFANQLQGEQRAQALTSIGVSAWDKVFHDPGTLDYESRGRLVTMGLDAIKKALDLKKDDSTSMVYYGLLLRQKAALEMDGEKRLAYEEEARQWQLKAQKAIEQQKKAQAAQVPANT